MSSSIVSNSFCDVLWDCVSADLLAELDYANVSKLWEFLQSSVNILHVGSMVEIVMLLHSKSINVRLQSHIVVGQVG